MNIVIGLIGSILIHLAVLLYSPQNATAKKQEAQEEKKAETISASIIPPKPTTNEVKGEKGSSSLTSECKSDHYYTGIGVFSTFDMITEVAPGGPADKAGIKIGDALVNRNGLAPNKFPAGHKLMLEIIREENKMMVEVIIDKICFDPKE